MDEIQTTPYQEFARQKLGFEYEHIELLVTALTHRSYVNEHRKTVHKHNERLEFLGDAVLELVVTDYLFKNYKEPEGILTNWRSALVRTESIGAAGIELGYEPLIRMSKGEKNDTRRAKEQILANAFEAVIGSIYLEKGYDESSKFIHKHIIVKLPAILEEGSWRDSKSYLQEIVQRFDNNTPQYRVLSEEGPDHDKTFVLGVYSGDKLIGQGTGSSKQAAQQAAAKNALKGYKDKIAIIE
jgi:ribonuclease-3